MLQGVLIPPIGVVGDYGSIKSSFSCRPLLQVRQAQGSEGHSLKCRWGQSSGGHVSRYRWGSLCREWQWVLTGAQVLLPRVTSYLEAAAEATAVVAPVGGSALLVSTQPSYAPGMHLALPSCLLSKRPKLVSTLSKWMWFSFSQSSVVSLLSWSEKKLSACHSFSFFRGAAFRWF